MPDDVLARAHWIRSRGDVREALRLYKSLWEIHKDSSDFVLDYAGCLAVVEGPAKAVAVLEDWLGLHHYVPRLGGLLAQCLYAVGRIEEGDRVAEKIGARNPTSLWAYRTAIGSKLARGELERAESLASEAGRRYGLGAAAALIYETCRRRAGDDEAERKMVSLLGASDLPDAEIENGCLTLLAAHRWEAVMRLLRSKGEALQGRPRLARLLAAADFRLGDYGAAAELLSRVCDEGEGTGSDWSLYGSSLRRTRRLDEAAVVFERGLASFPESEALRIGLVVAWWRLGRREEAAGMARSMWDAGLKRKPVYLTLARHALRRLRFGEFWRLVCQYDSRLAQWPEGDADLSGRLPLA